MFVLGIIIGFFAGGVIGFLTAALCVAAEKDRVYLDTYRDRPEGEAD
jgi:hypothetical protein